MAADEPCERCRFFCALDNTCRRDPPRAFPVGVNSGQVTQVTVFPVMQPSQWCGRFEPYQAPDDSGGLD